jgi:hypothetical protein
MVKYRVLYRDHFNNACRVDILTSAYSGAPIMLRGIEGQACTISYDCGDDPYEPIVNSKASINIHQEEHLPINISELQEADDRDFTVEFYINDVLNWKGFVIPDGIQQTFQSAPFDVNITATDGLMLLDGINYSHDNLDGGRCPINYFRRILFSESNLGLMLPIRWVCSLTNPAFPGEDVFSGSVTWSPRGEGFTDYNGNYKSCLYIIENMLRSFQCRMHQSEGIWKIERVNDIVSGTVVYKEVQATLGPLVVSTSSSVSILKTIGGDDNFDYRFIEEDALITVIPGLKSVKTTYEQDQRENILPNGNMDIVSLGIAPIYWGFNAGTSASMESVGSLSMAEGSAVKITNDASAPVATFQLTDEYFPIDTDVLYTYINFGFKFSIISGATTEGPEQYIVWDSTPFSFIMIYDDGANFWYLNEFGFWVENVTEISITIEKLKLGDVGQVDFNKRQNLIMPLPATSPILRTRAPGIRVGFFIPSGRVVVYDDIYINTDTNNDIYEATSTTSKNSGKEEYTLNISSSHNGFYVSNYMTNFSESGLEKFFSDGKFTGTLTAMNSHAIMRNRYKSSLLFEGSIYNNAWSYGEIYEIQTLTGKKFMPLRNTWNTETCTVNSTLVEVRDDDIIIDMAHYGSNDNTTLSN